jgi:hypothetical protein
MNNGIENSEIKKMKLKQKGKIHIKKTQQDNTDS